MGIKSILVMVCLMLFQLVVVPAYAATIFSANQVVTSTDRSATFDSLTTNSIDLSNYSEDSLFITVNDFTWVGSQFFLPNDTRTTGYHYANAGTNDYVSIRGTDNTIFRAIDFLFGDGVPSSELSNIRWESYLDGVMVGSGIENNLVNGIVVGWTDANGFDELRVAANHNLWPEPGFGNQQSIAIDDLRAQTVPVPTAIWLFGSGLLGLVGMTRRKKV